MNNQSLSGLLLISGFVLYVLAMLVAPRLYHEAAFGKRAEIIETQQIRWVLSQVLFALGMLLPAIGFLILTIDLQPHQTAWPLYLGATAFVAGGILGVVILYRQTRDPVGFWEREALNPMDNAYLFLTLAGFLFFGIAFNQGGFPPWLGYLNIAVALFSAVVYLIRRGSGAFFLTILFYLVALIDGIMLLRL